MGRGRHEQLQHRHLGRPLRAPSAELHPAPPGVLVPDSPRHRGLEVTFEVERARRA